MGNIAVITIQHDLLDRIAKDPKFGEKISHAISRWSSEPEEIDHGAYVIAWHHNTYTSMVKVTGARGKVIPSLISWEDRPKRVTKGVAIRQLRTLATRIEDLFNDSTPKFLRKVADLLDNDLSV